MIRQPRALFALLREYVGMARAREEPIVDRAGLRRFLETRASFVAQTSLYGYLRTRAGTRYPQLFEDDGFAVAINIAKWQIWLACLSDLAVYTGGLLTRHSPAAAARIGSLLSDLIASILDDAGVPAEAGPEFLAQSVLVRERLAACDWLAVTDDDGAFTQSPDALVHWSPVIDDLKQFDGEIVRNSIRFRWQEIRRDLRDLLQPAELLGQR